MTAYAPAAIQQLFAAIQARIQVAQFGGIVGDQQHSFGYHLARNDLPATDYSVQLPADHLGDGAAASALDVTLGLGSPLMITCTSRLLNAARAGDPRLRALRSFCGTTDGQNTHPYDLSNHQDGPLNSWDKSHLWHIHLSIYREFSNNWAALAPIADVFCGVQPAAPTSVITSAVEEEMYTLYQIPNYAPNANRVYAVRAGSVPIWLSIDDLNALSRFGLLANSKPKPILQTELDALTVAVKKGAL